MLHRQIGDLTEQDFKALVTNGVSEARDLEFKRDLPGSTDGDLKELLADLTSLANAQGGDLVFGMVEEEGVAVDTPGISVSDVDATLLRLENILRDGVEPRLSVKMQWVPMGSSHGMLVIRVPASLVAPHRVKFKGGSRFYTRNSRGKYEMDVHELRHAFTESEAMPRQLRDLHKTAVRAISDGNLPFSMGGSPRGIISVMPLTLLRERREIALTSGETLLPVRATSGFDWLPTIEGILWYTPPDEYGSVRSYALTHSAGYIDASWTFGDVREFRRETRRLVFADSFEAGVGEVASHGVARLISYGLNGPWLVSVTVTGIRGYQIIFSATQLSREAWRNEALLPELVLEHITAEGLMPIMRAFWLLFGTTRPT